MLELPIHPQQNWTGRVTGFRRSPFRADYRTTMRELEVELDHLKARNVRLFLAVTDDQIRIDGRLRAHEQPRHPGIMLTFDSKHGPMAYRADSYDLWKANLRAIALSLKALRAVDRYGMTGTGEQYAGFKALPSGQPETDLQRGRELIREHGSAAAAKRATHPDAGGDHDDFVAVQAAIEAGE